MKCWKKIITFVLFALCVRTVCNAQSFLVPQKFPETFADLDFVSKNEFKAEDYGSYADLSPYDIMELVKMDEDLENEIMNNAEQYESPGQTLPEQAPSQTTLVGGYCAQRQPGIPTNQKIPFGSPVLHSDYVYCSPYGVRNFGTAEKPKYDNHYGFDIGCTDASFGRPVFATADGVVTFVGHNKRGSSAGNYIKINHDNGFETLYIHLEDVLVQKNQRVFAGCQIGTIGNTGGAKAFKDQLNVDDPRMRKEMSHLHYEMHYQGLQTSVSTASGTSVDIKHGFDKNNSIDPTHFICVYAHFKYGCKGY